MGNGTFENLIPLLFIAFLLLSPLMKFLGRLMGKDFSDLSEEDEAEFDDYPTFDSTYEPDDHRGEGQVSDKPITPKWF